MYTARFAREQGRPVYTFDLPASGNQALIRDGRDRAEVRRAAGIHAWLATLEL